MGQSGLDSKWEVPGIRIRETISTTCSVKQVPTAVTAFVCAHEQETTPRQIGGVSGLDGYDPVVRHVLAGYFANGGGPCWLVPVVEHSPDVYARSIPELKGKSVGVTLLAAPDLMAGAGRDKAQSWLAAFCPEQEWIA
ncbi:hypothetical protein AB0K09_24795, partial [Streptomyces sp. NPDC049577]|uniref:hypothetical protein n=1 Tax=Streptomyces sp. NPDC049577 TaxID=3155153 RepID=UPI0034406B2E